MEKGTFEIEIEEAEFKLAERILKATLPDDVKENISGKEFVVTDDELGYQDMEIRLAFTMIAILKGSPQ